MKGEKLLYFKGSKKKALIFESGLFSMKKLLEHRKFYTESEIAFILVEQILPALDIFRQNFLSHFDLKPANFILFSNNGHFYYKLNDYGSILELKTKDPPTADLNEVKVSLTPFYTEKELLKKLRQGKISDNFNPFKHDLYSLTITILEMMGLNEDEINIFKNDQSIPAEKSINYPILLQVMFPFMIGDDILSFKEVKDIIEETMPIREEPNEQFYINEIEKSNNQRHFKPDIHDRKYVDLHYHVLAYMVLNSLKTGNINVETFIEKNRNYLPSKFSKYDMEIRDLISEFQAYDTLNNYEKAESALNRLEDVIIQNSDSDNFSLVRQIYISSFRIHFYERIKKIDKMLTAYKKMYWLSCKALYYLSAIKNLIHSEGLVKIVLDTIVFLFNPSHKCAKYVLAGIKSLLNINSQEIEDINKFTTDLNRFLYAFEKDFQDQGTFIFS